MRGRAAGRIKELETDRTLPCGGCGATIKWPFGCAEVRRGTGNWVYICHACTTFSPDFDVGRVAMAKLVFRWDEVRPRLLAAPWFDVPRFKSWVTWLEAMYTGRGLVDRGYWEVIEGLRVRRVIKDEDTMEPIGYVWRWGDDEMKREPHELKESTAPRPRVPHRPGHRQVVETRQLWGSRRNHQWNQ